MIPIIGPIDPYRRVCGALFLLMAAALAPNVYLAATLAISPVAASLSVWGLLGLYIAIIALPPLRRVTKAASWVALVCTGVVVAAAMLFADPITGAVADLIGFYNDDVAWSRSQTSSGSTSFTHPTAGYRLLLPEGWQQLPGPVEGTSELIRTRPGTREALARLRPSCDLMEQPLPAYVAALARDAPRLKRSCGHWHGMNTCLLMYEPGPQQRPRRWEWLGRDPAGGMQVRLAFALFDSSPDDEALAIINSLRKAPAGTGVAACVNPIEWAEPF